MSDGLRRTLEEPAPLVKAAGASVGDVVLTRVCLVNMEGKPVVQELRRKFFRSLYPPNTLVEVKGLAQKDWLIEIEAIAALGN